MKNKYLIIILSIITCLSFSAKSIEQKDFNDLVKIDYNVSLSEKEKLSKLGIIGQNSSSEEVKIISSLIKIRMDIERLNNKEAASTLDRLKAEIFEGGDSTKVKKDRKASAIFWYSIKNYFDYSILNYQQDIDYVEQQQKIFNSAPNLQKHQDYFNYLNIITQHSPLEFEEQLALLYRLIDMSEIESDINLRIHALQGLGNIHMSGISPEKAIAYLKEAISIIDKNNIKTIFAFSTKINLTFISPPTSNGKSNIEVAEEMIEAAESSNDITLRYTAYIAAANAYAQMGNNIKIKELISLATPLSDEFSGMKSFYYYYVYFFVHVNNMEGNFKSSRALLDKFYNSLTDTDSAKVYPVLTAYYMVSEQTNIALGDYKSAYDESNKKSQLLATFLKDKYETASFKEAQRFNTEREKQKAKLAESKLLSEQSENKFKTLLLLASGISLLVIIMFLIKQIKHSKSVEKLSNTDILTGISNRRHLMQELGKKWNIQEEVNSTFILFDIDKFKLINDTYGHGVGDKAIKHVVNLAKSHCRATDIFARIGGEEFLLVLNDTTTVKSLDIAERIRKSLEDSPMKLKGSGDIKITALSGNHNQVKLGIEAPEDVEIWRDEIYEQIEIQNSE